MQETDKPVLVYTTFPSGDTAEEAGAKLVEAGLAACVNVLPGMISIYVWEGKRQRSAEAVLIVKTRMALSGAVMDAIASRHPDDNPALLVLPVAGGSNAFLSWIMSETEAAASGPAA